MRKLLLPALLLVLTPAALFGGSFGSQAKGTTAATFLELGVGGRAMGMGGAFTAVANDATALYWNPAGLTAVEKRAATFMHAAYVESSYYDYGAYAQKLGEHGALGLGFQYLNAGAITQTDANFNEMGSVTPNDLALSLGYARKLEGLGPLADGASIGVSAKFIRSTIIHTAQTTALDAGVLSPWLLGRKLRLGFAVTNVGGTLKYAETAENLPLTFKAGAAYKPRERWTLSLDVAAPRDNAPYAAAGTEYLFPVIGAWTFSGRMGYNSQTLGDVSGLSGYTLGVGFGAKTLNFDYAFSPMGGLGVTNRFSASIKF